MAKRYLEIQKEIQRRISDGEWPVGYKLPREAELCILFDASRTTVRRALSAPVAEGKLRRIKGTGTFVSRPQIFEKTTFFIQSFAEELKNQGLSDLPSKNKPLSEAAIEIHEGKVTVSKD